MMNIKIKYSRTVVTATFTLLLILTSQIVEAASSPPVLPPTANAYGKNYAEWSAAWMKWVLPIPASVNPILDNTGAFAAYGQSGKVWFLAGTTGTGAVPPVVRTITIPTGTSLFFPIVNYFWVNTPEFGDPAWSPAQEANARAIIANVIDSATGLSLEIDELSVQNLDTFRFQSPVFWVKLPIDNIFGVTFLPGPHPGVADGYWALLPPLSVGSHTIHFKGGFTVDGFSLDVTYHITVKPGHNVRVPLHH